MNETERTAKLDAIQQRLAACQAEIQGPTTAAQRRRIESELRAVKRDLKAIPPRYQGRILPEHREAILRGLPSRHPQNTAPAPAATAKGVNTTTAV